MTSLWSAVGQPGLARRGGWRRRDWRSPSSRKPLPRYKTCGGGIVGRAMQALPMDIHHVVEQDCHTAQLNFFPVGLSFTTHRPTPIVSMTMRDQFDYALLSAAQGSEAVVHQRCAVE